MITPSGLSLKPPLFQQPLTILAERRHGGQFNINFLEQVIWKTVYLSLYAVDEFGQHELVKPNRNQFQGLN